MTLRCKGSAPFFSYYPCWWVKRTRVFWIESPRCFQSVCFVWLSDKAEPMKNSDNVSVGFYIHVSMVDVTEANSVTSF